MADLVNDGEPDVRGRDALRRLRAIDEAVYAGGETTFDMTFAIADGDFVAIQAVIGAKSHEGDPYENTYVFSFRCADGKIAEAWEVVDTKYWCDTIIGRPEQLEGVKARIAAARSSWTV
jgi:ketosteroid isomerase-like protein